MRSVVLMIMVATLAAGVSRPAHAMPAFSASGFGDFLVSLSGDDARAENFALGQVEVDLGASWESRTTVDLAVAYDPEAEAFGLGALTAAFLLNDPSTPWLAGQTGWAATLSVGRFDVPFGVDHRHYASPDRRFVTVPLAVDGIHGCWNDVGVKADLDGPAGNAMVFAVNGFGCRWRGVSRSREEVARSLGGRLGLKPASSLELGASAALFYLEDGIRTANLVGVDLSWQARAIAFRGELFWQSVAEDQEALARHHGGYAQALYQATRFYGGLRYDVDHPSHSVGILTSQLVQVLGWHWRPGVQLRLEHRHVLERAESAAWLQMVVAY